MIVTLLGWVGALACVAAYGMVSMGKWSASSMHYQVVNVVGAALLCVVAARSQVWPSVTANVIWVLIGARAVALLVRDRRLGREAAGTVPELELVEDAAPAHSPLVPTQACRELSPVHASTPHASTPHTPEGVGGRSDLADAAVLVA